MDIDLYKPAQLVSNGYVLELLEPSFISSLVKEAKSWQNLSPLITPHVFEAIVKQFCTDREFDNLSKELP